MQAGWLAMAMAVLACTASAATAATAPPSSPAAASTPDDGDVPYQQIASAPPGPLYCELDSGDIKQFKDIEFSRLYETFRHKLGWTSRIGLAYPGQPKAELVAVFADFGPDDSYTHMVRFFLRKHEAGWVLVYSDFVEPDRPHMWALGDPLCDYVEAAARGPGAT